MGNLRTTVFWPPFLLILLALFFSFYDSVGFVAFLNRLNDWVLTHFSHWFAGGALIILAVCIVAFFSPLGRVCIGGDKASRLLKPGSYCAVSLCTSTAVGIMFWGMAEPMIHYGSPPSVLGIAPQSEAAARFALSTLYLHWSFTPCALYALPALMFAFAFYNMKQPFSLSSPLAPLLGTRATAAVSSAVDAVSLYALVAGMAASLATGILTLAGGLQYEWGVASAPGTWIMIGLSIVAAFITSAVLGLDRGIKVLSNVNTLFFFGLAGFVLFCGPTLSTLALGATSLSEYAATFVDRSLFLSFPPADPWPRSWTVFYWAVWLAWAPVTAAFLGKIGVGYTVRSFLLVNLAVPALFSLLWMLIFGGTALSLEHWQSAGLQQVLQTKGPEALVYSVLGRFPFGDCLIPVFLFTAFIAYVTAADSNTVAMASMSSRGISCDDAEPGLRIKLVWGTTVGVLSLVMLCLCGVDGIKTLSYLGGLPALFYELLVAGCVLRICFNPSRFDVHAPIHSEKPSLTFGKTGGPIESRP